MERIFILRDIFHKVAASEMPQSSSSTVVCWVDVILVKLSHAMLAVIGGHCGPKGLVSETLTQHREEMTLRAILQLPRRSLSGQRCHVVLLLMSTD